MLHKVFAIIFVSILYQLSLLIENSDSQSPAEEDWLTINSSLANGDKSPSDKIFQMHTQSSQQACPT